MEKEEVSRKPKKLASSDVNYIINLKEKDITYDLLKEFFAFKPDKDARFLPNDYFILEKGRLYNKESERTTVGKYLFNLFVLSPNLIKLLGYQNYEMSGGGIKTLNNKISNLLLKDNISTKDVHQFIDKMQWLGFRISRFMNASLTYKLLIPPESVEKKKEELLAKYKKAIDNKDIAGIGNLEKELIEFAKKECVDIPDMQIYNSGGRGSFKNNYKNTSLMRGAIKNYANPEDITVSTSSLVEGINPDELPAYADLITSATASRALSTRKGGYESKKITTALQNLKLDVSGSDCGTTLTIPVIIKPSNKKLYLYRYIVQGDGTLLLLDESNIDKYVNKLVNMRSPMKCKGKHFCSKCAGELYYMLGDTENVGLIIQRMASRLLNLSLKSFHDMTISTTNISISDYISEIS